MEEVFEPPRSKLADERVCRRHIRLSQRRAEIGEALLGLLLPDIGNRPRTNCPLLGSRQKLEIFIKIGEFQALPSMERHERSLAIPQRPICKPAQTLPIVGLA